MTKTIFNDTFFAIKNKDEMHSFEFLGQKVNKRIKYNYVVRPPGVRALIIENNRILLTKEYRYELNTWDYRLPGGKVYNTINDYNNAQKKESILEDVRKTLFREVFQEAGYEICDYELLKISKNGLKIHWDLYYFKVTSGKQISTVNINDYEYVTTQWFSFNEVLNLCQNNQISEDRSVAIILTALLTLNNKE